jgi:hypothetical protein
VEVLNQRLAEARQGSGGAAAAAAAAAEEAAAEAELAEEQRPSFLRSTDEELSSALSDRIAQVAKTAVQDGGGSSSDGGGGGGGAEASSAGLTGPLMRELIVAKWGKTYDLSFARRDLPLGKTLVCLNVSAPLRSKQFTLERT